MVNITLFSKLREIRNWDNHHQASKFNSYHNPFTLSALAPPAFLRSYLRTFAQVAFCPPFFILVNSTWPSHLNLSISQEAFSGFFPDQTTLLKALLSTGLHFLHQNLLMLQFNKRVIVCRFPTAGLCVKFKRPHILWCFPQGKVGLCSLWNWVRLSDLSDQ